LLAAIAKHGAERIDAEGQPFDPEHHEEVAQIPREEVHEGHVAEVVQTGYRLYDRTLRASRVVVSSGPPNPGSAAEDETGAEPESTGDEDQ
jgi:molecular chaperone GrpE